MAKMVSSNLTWTTMKVKKYNRIKKTLPKAGKSHWCFGCDAFLVRIGEKCKVCGKRAITKHQKP